MSTVLETLKIERSRLLSQAEKMTRAIQILEPTAFVNGKTNGNGNGNGNGHHKPVHWTQTPEGKRKLSRAMRKAWREASPERRAKWARSVGRGQN